MPPHAANSTLAPDLPARLSAVTTLVDQIDSWAAAEGWSIERGQVRLDDEGIGAYSLPTLRIRTLASRNELFVMPIGLQIVGADARVDLEVWPSLDRVMLLRCGDAWRVVTDSNMELDEPWRRETFLAIAKNLVTRTP